MATGVAREWREIPARYNLIGSRCENCGKIFFPARSLCPECRRAGMGMMKPYKLSGKGEIYSFSVVHDSPDFNSAMMPYAVAFVKDDDGVLIAGQVVDTGLEGLKIGMRVHTVFRKLSEDGKAGIIKYGFKFAPDI